MDRICNNYVSYKFKIRHIELNTSRQTSRRLARCGGRSYLEDHICIFIPLKRKLRENDFFETVNIVFSDLT